MGTLLRLLIVGVFFAGISALGQNASYRITGVVNTVGVNHAPVVEGLSFGADADRFEINLRFDWDQAPAPLALGGGVYGYYKLHETRITIQADGGPLTWSYSFLPSYASDHALIIRNNVSGIDGISAGVDDGVLTGSTINGQIVTSWFMNLLDAQGAIFSDTSLPEVIDVGVFETRVVMLGVGNEGFHPANLITMEIDGMELMSAGAIPEPSTWAAIAGGLSLGVAAWVRRRQRNA